VIIFVIFSLVFKVNFLVDNLDKVFGALLAFGLALIPFSYFIGLVLFTKSSSAMKTFPLFNFFITYSMPWNIWGIMNLIQ
jgi:ATP-binding cassette subfamily A (ABC1) protein 3